MPKKNDKQKKDQKVKKTEPKVISAAKPKIDPQIEKLQKKNKKYRGLIVDLLQALDTAHDHQDHVKCFECGHFYKEAYDRAKKI